MSEDIAYRQRRYLIMMGIRLVCFVIAVVLFVNGGRWLTAIPAVGAIVIPYIAVVFANGGREETPHDPVEWALRMQDANCGEILLTSMDRDGTKAGFDIALTRAVADAVRVPVIASGGVGTLDHLVEGIRDGHATGVLAASIFHFGTYRIGEAKAWLAAHEIPVRR